MIFFNCKCIKIMEGLIKRVSLLEAKSKPATVYSKLPKKTLSVELPDDPILGSLSAKYESGTRGAGTVSTGKGDPGGVSYGLYQLSSKAGTCAAFIRYLKKLPMSNLFEGLFKHKPGTKLFSVAWRRQAKEMKTFGMVQHAFIKKTHYDPVRSWATKCGLMNHPVVNQVLWSIGVNHGGAKKITTSATRLISRGSLQNPSLIINALYDARVTYVKKVRMPSRTLKSLLNRYKRERADALGML
jgi:Type VI secretion system spike protein VgrG3-like, C-terminal